MAVSFGVSQFLIKDYFVNDSPITRLPIDQYAKEKYLSLSDRLGRQVQTDPDTGAPLTPSDPGYIPEPTQSFIATVLPSWLQPNTNSEGSSDTNVNPEGGVRPDANGDPRIPTSTPPSSSNSLAQNAPNPGIETHKKPDGTTETVVDLSNLVVEQKTYVSAGTPVTVEYPKGQEPPPQELIDLLAR
jgi:hypothetical protein